ncbi:hypothetical protein D4S03_04195 [bacterium]|nr:MAG: hypothetical protein D4S03_04195 [bacterium]
MQTIVTVCNKDYQTLLPLWLGEVRLVTAMPVTVLALAGTETNSISDCTVIPIDPAGNPFPADMSDHACAEKLRIFHHLPKDVEEVLFLDIDVMVLNDFWTGANYLRSSRRSFIAAPDLFVGYKEKLEAEFQPFDPEFRMKYFSNGQYFYFNTGAFFASRTAHSRLFAESLKVWSEYVSLTGKYPSIFDQNVFNYCLIRFGVNVIPMPIQNNCLRQYNPVWVGGRLQLQGKTVNAYHFNGGNAEVKLRRWQELNQHLGVSP